MDNYLELKRILSRSTGQLLQFVKSVPTCSRDRTDYNESLIGPPKDGRYVLRDFIPEKMHATFYKPVTVNRSINYSFDVQFEQLVYPTKIGFYKNVFPYDLLRIRARQYGKGAEWSVMWDKRYDGLFSINSSELFLPIIRTIQHRTRELRFEFDIRKEYYFIDFHGIALVGVVNNPEPDEHASRSTPNSLSPVTNVMNITQLPYEVLFKIFSNLKIPTLYVVEQVCKTFATVVADAHLYREVYQCFPYEMSGKHLRWLSERCSGIKKLNIAKSRMSQKFRMDMHTFMRQHGHTLTHLCVTCYPCLSEIPFSLMFCPNLTELGLHNLAICSWSPSQQNNCNQLIKLDMTGRRNMTQALVSLLQQNPNLQHLNLMFREAIDNYVIETIGQYNRELLSLNLSYINYDAGRVALKSCFMMQELDLGRYSTKQSLNKLMENIPGIRWLGLDGSLQTGQHVLAKTATHCPKMQFLDLDECRELSGESVDAILARCPKLRLLKLADCGQIEYKWFIKWEWMYPPLNIEDSQSETFEVQAVAMSFPTRR